MKGYNVTVNLPNLPEGAEVQVDGLGILLNGEATFVSEDIANHWHEMSRGLVQQFDKRGRLHTELGDHPDLVQTFGSIPGFTVTAAEAADVDLASGKINEPETQINVQEQLPLDQQNDGGDKE